MIQEQGFVTPTGVRKNTIRRAISSRLRTSMIIGVGITLLLSVIAVGVFWLLNSRHMPGLIALSPLLLLAPVGILVVMSLLAMLVAKPIALIRYLRGTHTAQEEYHRLYTPLKAVTNIRKPIEDYQQDRVAPAILQEEQASILDLIEQQDTHQLILGVPGAGKTMALHVYQYTLSQQPFSLVMARARIPVYVPMKNYSLFLKKQQIGSASDEQGENRVQGSILDFLYESDLAGMQHLRGYLPELSRQGRLLLLCDGLNEVDSNYLTRVSEELVWWMRDTRNRLVMTCREVDYREQQDFVQLVEEGYAARAVIYPLQPEQVSEFVERYIERQDQDQHWRHTAGQILQVIDRSRLRYHCTNPMMLFTLMGIIDRIGIERGRQIDTRGRLLREYVKQLIEYEQRQIKWSRGAPTEREVIRFLSEVACAARWANDRNAIQLRISLPAGGAEGQRASLDFDELADELQFWLDEHPAKGPFGEEGESEASTEPYTDLAQLVQFALSAALIEISPGGVLSFRHELIAEYFVAEYFFSADGASSSRPLREELLENVGRWSEPVAIWAGLLEKPLVLAERFGAVGRNSPAYVLQALALGLVCVGVLWAPPQMGSQPPILLPSSLEEALAIAVRNRAAREELARIFTRCAEEGGQEVYRSLLPLIMVDGVDELLTLLDQTIVPELLFAHLKDAVDNVAYEAQVKRLTRVLGRFGSVVVERAALLGQPAAGRTSRLRAAAINILGGTRDQRAVEPLVVRLSDADPFIVERATNALIRLGPELTLIRILQELEKRVPGPFTLRIHQAALTILGRFLDEQDVRSQVSLIQYLRILETIVPILTSNYQMEPQVQQQALEILVGQGRNTTEASARDNRWEKVIEALLRYLPSQNEVAARNVILALQEIGGVATPYLLTLLEQPSDILRMRIVEVLREVRDPHALPQLLRLVNDPSPLVQQQVDHALLVYAPDSIAGLIDLVLNGPSDAVAERAAHILAEIGQLAVESITRVLFHIVPGRTRLLVQVLAEIHDPESVPALVTLLQMAQGEPLLMIALIRAISQFPEKRVVAPLLAILTSTKPQLYEEAIDALGQLGAVALEELIAALNGPLDGVVAVRVRRVLLGMAPFPGSQLLTALGQCSDIQAQQITLIFRTQGADAALVLVQHLQHPNERVRQYVQATLSDMAGPVVVPALLEVLNQPALRKVASAFLLKYPDAAISPLVDLLGERERGDTAALILSQFGPRVLRPLISGLDDQRSMAREYAQHIIVTLVRQSQHPQDVLHEIVHLFTPALPTRARDVLLGVLTNELSDVSLPALLEGLEDAHLIEDVAEAFAQLAHREAMQQIVLENLLKALYVGERRRGAETALIYIGAPAVVPVGALIADANPVVAKAAKDILCEIGVPALSFIWMTHSDRSNPARRAAALDIFHSMRTEVIKDELVDLLVSDKPDGIAMAVTLLMERIHDEAKQHYADREMIPELIEYIQTHGVEETNLRIIALLLMLDEQTIVDHLVQTLDDYQQHRRQLIYSFLLLGERTQEALLAVFKDSTTSSELRAEVAAILGMTRAPDVVTEYAQRISAYGLTATRSGVLAPEQLAIALRALGGVLAGGYWNVRKIQEMRDASKEGSPAYELFNVLLGWRYEPQLAQLQSKLQDERDAHKQAIKEMTARIVEDQQHLQALDDELTQVRREHGSRGDELEQISQEKETLRGALGQATKERDTHRATASQLAQEKSALSKSLEQAIQEKKILTARLERTLQEKKLLTDQNERLIQQMNQPQGR
ncbi:MAG TPA: HEAT repeat domain-containing protein [Ktedonosporobacter sp.]|nr:HEAT repeat domain-containing protein [Ktedonosporobacter sp.]